MLRREIIAVCFEIHTKHINTLGVKGLKIEHYVPSAGFGCHKGNPDTQTLRLQSSGLSSTVKVPSDSVHGLRNNRIYLMQEYTSFSKI
jgi:hypothetical protein